MISNITMLTMVKTISISCISSLFFTEDFCCIFFFLGVTSGFLRNTYQTAFTTYYSISLISIDTKPDAKFTTNIYRCKS